MGEWWKDIPFKKLEHFKHREHQVGIFAHPGGNSSCYIIETIGPNEWIETSFALYDASLEEAFNAGIAAVDYYLDRGEEVISYQDYFISITRSPNNTGHHYARNHYYADVKDPHGDTVVIFSHPVKSELIAKAKRQVRWDLDWKD